MINDTTFLVSKTSVSQPKLKTKILNTMIKRDTELKE